MGRVHAAVVLAAVLGLVWMHALVAPASASASVGPAVGPSSQVASAPAEHSDGHSSPSGGGHHEGLGVAHLCLAVLAVGAGLLLAGRTLLRVTRPCADGPEAPGPITRRATWNLPPPDLLSALSISRT